jgi:glyoxylase-like metal-dependent hydrolase (beta-lactamase superfamily II)
MSATYEIFAVRYGHHDRNAADNFIGGDPHNGPMPLDYFVWAIVGSQRTFILDTGFDQATGNRRNRTLLRPVCEGLKAIGIEPETVKDVIISHMHFDHAGNHTAFPQARYHLQRRRWPIAPAAACAMASCARPMTYRMSPPW